MKDFSEYEHALRNNPNSGKLMEAANSEEGRRIAGMLDAAKVENAVKSGDTAALKALLSQVLSTADGQALAKKLNQALKKD